jgi:type II secretory pathway pseudopilin PulG
MRAVFTVLGMVVVLAIVGMLAKKQLSAGVAPSATGAPSAATPQQQVQQFRNAVEGAMQPPRPMPDEPK